MSKAKSAEEVRNELLAAIRRTAAGWAAVPDKTPAERCDGLAFSLLTIFDGETLGLPAFDISPAPHEDDKQYHIDLGEDWYEAGMVINDCPLHELYYADETRRKEPE